MSKWYKSALVKGILIFLSVLSAITALLSLVIISTYSVSVKEIWNKKPTEYTDSKEFENQMCRATMDVLGQISYEDIFETDGKYNPDKLIDIMQYGYNGRHYDEETERLRYKLSDLQKWSEEYQNNYATQENPIVVCQKADKTYHYYYWDEFLSLLKKKTLTVDIDGYTSDEIVNALASGNVSLSQFAGHDILDEKGETVYRDFWGFSGAIEEEARPDGGNNILDVVNQTPQLNGKLSEVYAQLGSILSNLYYDFQSYQNSAEWTEGNTNFAYIFVDKETKKVSSATLQNFIEDRDAFAKNILGAKKEVTKNGETYTANENQVIFDGNKFSFVPKTPVTLSETHGIDAVNASKKGKKIAAYYGFDSQNALIVSSDDNGKYHIFMTYTIENLPVFNDYMTFDITSDGLIGFSGVWFTQNSLGEYRNTKSVADALLEFSASKDKPNGKIEISDITLGYNIVDFDTSPTELQPVWRITLKDGSKYYINA